jgi:hypothetical protein
MTTEETESSEQTSDTSVAEESASQTESVDASTQEAAPSKKESESQVPFHEHPRFKELIEERRAFKEQLDQTRGYTEALQRELQALRVPRQDNKPEEPKHKELIEHLRSINPSFAQFQEELINNLEATRKEASIAKELQKRLDAYEQREFQTQALSRISNLMESNKIPESLRKRYDREIRALAYDEEIQGKKLGLNDVDRLFKSVHDDYTPFIETLKRDTLKGYVKEKKQDTAPASTTGGAPQVPGKKKIASLDSEEGFRGATKWMAEQLRQAKRED